MDLKIKKTKLVEIGSVKIPDTFYRRITSGIDKLDVLFGGSALPGALPGSTFTLTAPGGCGKTTLMLHWLDALTKLGYRCAIVSGEESIYQIAFNAKRLNVEKVMVANMNDIDEIAALGKEYDVVVIDSFQSMRTKEELNSRELEKYVVETVCEAAKKTECIFGFIMHHTKSGQMKGGTIIIHTVDANFGIEIPDDTETRCIFTDGKNRFGPPGEFTAPFTAQGYDFTIDCVESASAESKRMGSSPEGSKGAERKANIEKLKAAGKEKGSLTLRNASEILGDMQKARFLMSDLHLQGVFVKTGRGEKAAFKYVEPVKEEVKPTETKTDEGVQG